MAVTTTNLGVITAYGDAVAAGYTGTKAEWQALMASYATVGQQAVDAKNAAVAAKDTAVAKSTEATTAASTATTKANEASASAQSIAQSAAQIQENTDDIDQLKSGLSCVNTGIEGRYNAYDTLQLRGNNSAVTSNGDGTYTVGTSDYGASIFGSATLLKAGMYFLFGVPQGYSFLSTTNSHTEAIFTNDSSEPKGIVLESDTTLYLGFRVSQNPNTSFVIRPFLYSTKMEENAKDIEALKSGLSDLGLSVEDGVLCVEFGEDEELEG